MFDVKTSGTLSSEGQYRKKVHIAYDRIIFDQTCDLNILVQIEPPSILDITDLIRANTNKYDLILTWNEDLLDLPNAQKFVFGSCWINQETFEPNKGKYISFNTSNKGWAPGHQLRQQIWEGLEDAEDLNGFGIIKHKSPPRIPTKDFLFEVAKYHIVVENEQRNNWITEKLIDCLATRTIPIYWGASNIGEYFNTDGMIIFNTIEELKDILDNLDEKFYDDRVDIINENFERSKEYWDFHARVRKTIEDYINYHD
jgi:hypothetical protein